MSEREPRHGGSGQGGSGKGSSQENPSTSGGHQQGQKPPFPSSGQIFPKPDPKKP